MGKVSTVTYFLLEISCEDSSFLDQPVEDYEQGLDSILADSTETPELDDSFDKSDAITFSISSGFVCSVSTLSGNFKLQVAPSIKAQKLLCQTRALPLGVAFSGKMSPSNLIHYF